MNINTESIVNQAREMVGQNFYEGIRRMVDKYGVQITKIFLHVDYVTYKLFNLDPETDDPDFYDEDFEKRYKEARYDYDRAIDLLYEMGLNLTYFEYLDTPEYEMVNQGDYLLETVCCE